MKAWGKKFHVLTEVDVIATRRTMIPTWSHREKKYADLTQDIQYIGYDGHYPSKWPPGRFCEYSEFSIGSD